MSHAASAGGSSADGLDGPVVSAELGAATEASILFILLVPVGLAGPSADGVALVVTLTLRLSSCTLHTRKSQNLPINLPYLFSNKIIITYTPF